jgi:hypothetical protein
MPVQHRGQIVERGTVAGVLGGFDDVGQVDPGDRQQPDALEGQDDQTLVRFEAQGVRDDAEQFRRVGDPDGQSMGVHRIPFLSRTGVSPAGERHDRDAAESDRW